MIVSQNEKEQTVDTCEVESNSNDYEIMGSKWALERPQTSSLGSKYKGQMHGARCAWNGENLYISKSIYTTKRGEIEMTPMHLLCRVFAYMPQSYQTSTFAEGLTSIIAPCNKSRTVASQD